MRSSKSLILAGSLTALAVIMAGLGCSNDTHTTTLVPVPQDNSIEAHLQEVASQVDAHVDSALTVFESGLRVATFIDIGAGDIGDAFMGAVLPDSTAGEHNWIVSWATDLQSGLGTLNIVDSLTYINNHGLTINAKDAYGMHIKHHYTYESSDTTISFTDVATYGNLGIADINTNTATITGTFSTEVHDKAVTDQSTVWNDWTIETQVDNIAVTKSGSSWTDGCPASGTMDITVQHRYAQDLDVPTITYWEITVTFTNGDADIDVVTGQLSTSYQNSYCTP